MRLCTSPRDPVAQGNNTPQGQTRYHPPPPAPPPRGKRRPRRDAATGSYAAASALWDVTTLRTSPARLFRPDALLHALTGSPLPALSGPPLTAAERDFLSGLKPWV